MRACCFIGQSNSEIDQDRIHQTVRTLRGQGIDLFYTRSGNAFERECEKAVKNLGGYLMYIPISAKQLNKKRILTEYCGFLLVEDCDKWMVDHSEVMICWARDSRLVNSLCRYAMRTGVRVMNLNMR